MENHQLTSRDDEIEGEDFPEDFQCCVCLDLFYKPVVLACGHIACFWCVFKCMDNWQQSYCMVCRYPYGHFPRVCKLLHCLLLKLYPLSYNRRERQVSEVEKEFGSVSPQFDDYLSETRAIKEMDGRILSNYTVNAPNLSSPSEGGPSTIGISSQVAATEDSKLSIISQTNCEATAKVPSQENIAKYNGPTDGDHKHMLSTVLMCSLCKQLLCRPVVLNCGDVFCETCIVGPEDKIPKCPVCHSAHPTGFPNVCLVLEHFLEDQFQEEYKVRKHSLIKSMGDQPLNKSNGSKEKQMKASNGSSVTPNFLSSWFSGQGPNVHVGVGCDYCGMCPIIGERYKCKDCVEKVGFDLCQNCYQGSSNLPGRFNQQHKEDHKFEKVEIHLNELILRVENFDDDDDNDDGSHDHEDTEAEATL